jgi:flagellar biosynthesis/type III secretory pathway chaperone
MSETNDLRSQVTKQFTSQKLRLQQLQVILNDELAAVKDRDGNLILDITKKKELQLEAIKNADALLNKEKYVQVVNSTQEFSTIKAEINDLVLQCKHLNEVVYLTATQNQIAIEQVKQLLFGGSKNTTYDAYGKKSSSSSLSTGIKA